MREIKFRAWDLDNHEMYYSHLEESNGEDKIDWRIDCDGVFFEEIQIIDTCPGGKGHKQSREWRKPNQIAMQYTGLKDKNGKEIYEGDVVEVKYETSSWGRKIKYNFVGKVVFGSFSTEEREGCSEDIEGWYILAPCEVTSKMTDTYSLADHNHNCEIIGKVHENPELIKL